MPIVDKSQVLSRIKSGEVISLELGCGQKKRNPSAVGIDLLAYDCIDIQGDAFEVLSVLPNSCVKSVYTSHFLEHIDDLPLLFKEIGRVLIPGGEVEVIVPHFSNPYFYSDPTHRIFFGLYTFCYLCANSPFSRQVPTYQNELLFSLERVDLRFQSARPFYFRYALKLVIGRFFNSCNYMKEFYEENFCYIFPCYEVYYLLRRVDVPVART
jgi:ubiquinone/menaquinone biosynthesis C-methylase UbiE